MCDKSYTSKNSLITYRLICSRSDKPGKENWPYGIYAEMTLDGKVHSCAVENVFRCKDDAEVFIARLAENEVEPCHLRDVLCDFLLN